MFTDSNTHHASPGPAGRPLRLSDCPHEDLFGRAGPHTSPVCAQESREVCGVTKGGTFPQTGTVFQWSELEEFEAYRHLDYLMGWTYLSTSDFQRELKPSAARRVL